MSDALRNGPFDRDIEKAITALKKGARLLKYGRRGKPKFCPFRLSVDESILIWYVGKDEKHLVLNSVSKIIPGQRTAIFQRYPQPDKEYQSFSLLYHDRSLDLICKDKDEAEVWFVGLKALISWKKYQNRFESSEDRISEINGPNDISKKDSIDSQRLHFPYEALPSNGFGKALSDVILYTESRSSIRSDSICSSLSSIPSGVIDYSNGRNSGAENLRNSVSSAISSSSRGSGLEDFDALSDVFVWGEIIGDGLPSGGFHNSGSAYATKIDVPLPKAFEAAVLLDVHHVGCGSRHSAWVTKHGEVYSWGEGSGGRLGHGIDADASNPKLIHHLDGIHFKLVECGEYHTCALTFSGDLYTWGDGVHNSGLLGHGSEASHWIPKLVVGPLECVHVSSLSCGPWHTAIVTSEGQLFTYGDGLFGALGHGDRENLYIPREVGALKGMRTVRVACGVWHTAAVVEIINESAISDNSLSGRLFTWGDGDNGRLGHGDKEPRLVPACIITLADICFCRVASGQDITIALTTSGRVYTVGSSDYGQLGNPEADGSLPTCVQGKLCDSFVEEIACGSYHTAVLTSSSEVYTWGKGSNGRLGHGDNDDRNVPTLVEALKGKQIKKIVCGSNFTAVICLHKWISSDDLATCSGCHLPFGFRRKQHNCYNCGFAFCKLCSTRKSVKAALAPNIHKPYRVCDDCYTKIKKGSDFGLHSQIPRHPSPSQLSSELGEKEAVVSRLSSFISFKGDNRHKQSWESEPNNSRSFSVINENFRWGTIPNTVYSSKKMFSVSVPGSRIGSRSPSPVSNVSSPQYSAAAPILTCPASPEVIVDYSTKTNVSLSEEEVSLHSQVQDLTHKSQLLEAELEKTLAQLREATAVTGEETAKCEAAKEVIKSLTAQLKDTAERLADEYVIDANGILAEESVQQDEPGVYITISSSPGGEIYLKRVNFSRKHFDAQEAEKWWSDNRPHLRQKYKFPFGEQSLPEPSSLTEMIN